MYFKFNEYSKSIKYNEIKELYIVYNKNDKSINRIKLESSNQNIYISDFSHEARKLIAMKLMEKVEDKYIRARASGD